MKPYVSLTAFLGLCLFGAPSTVYAGKVSQPDPAQKSSATQMKPGTYQIKGMIFKHHKTSQMRFNLELSNSERSGFGVFGTSQVVNSGGKVEASFDGVSGFRVGSASSKMATAAENGLYSKELDLFGSLKISGLRRGPRAFDGSILGLPIRGFFELTNGVAWTTSKDGINFDKLYVNDVQSKGDMAYWEGGYDSYYAYNQLRFGAYEIHAIDKNNKNTPIMAYFEPPKNYFDLDFLFGDFHVKGTIQFTDTDETRFEQFYVRVQDPSISIMTSQMRMRNIQRNQSYYSYQINEQMIRQLDQATTRTEIRNRPVKEIVATQGEYNLTIEPIKRNMGDIDADVDSPDTEQIASLKALLSYLMLSAYDSFSE